MNTLSQLVDLSLANALTWMKQHGSSVDVNWGEDTGGWEVSWITGGKRYTGVHTDLRQALKNCVERVQ